MEGILLQEFGRVFASREKLGPKGSDGKNRQRFIALNTKDLTLFFLSVTLPLNN